MSTTTQKVLGVVVVAGALMGALALFILLFGGAGHSFGLATSPQGDVVPNLQWMPLGLNLGSAQQFTVDSSGNVVESGNVSNSGTTQIGANGTKLNHLISGIAQVIAYANTIAASSSARVDLGTTGAVGGTLTGVVAGDACDGFATTTVGAWLGVDVIGSFASTTNGYCTLQLANNTGATFTWSAQASTSFAYQDIK